MARWFRGVPLALATLAGGSGLAGCPSTDGFTGGGGDAANDTNQAPDVASDGETADAADGGSDGGRCDLAKPFTTPTGIGPSDDNTVPIYGARMSADELTMVYVEDDPLPNDGGIDPNLYMTTRANTSSLFSAGTKIPVVNSAVDDVDPFLSDDGLTLWFSSLRVSPMQFFVTHRANALSQFSVPVAVSSNGINVDVQNVFFMPDGVNAYFIESLATSNSIELAQVTPDAGIQNPTDAYLPQDGSQWPCVTGDGLTMIYDFQDGNGVYLSTRASTSVTFAPGAPVAELNGPSNTYTFPTWISRDGCDVALSSDRSGVLQIYTAHRGQ